MRTPLAVPLSDADHLALERMAVRAGRGHGARASGETAAELIRSVLKNADSGPPPYSLGVTHDDAAPSRSQEGGNSSPRPSEPTGRLGNDATGQSQQLASGAPAIPHRPGGGPNPAFCWHKKMEVANGFHVCASCGLVGDPDERQKLTGPQTKVLEFIREHLFLKGFAPSVREICADVGYKSTNAVVEHLNRLRRKGYIDFDDGKSRTIRLVEAS